jgi:hypothetical protein
VVLTTSNIAEGSNQYHTTARVSANAIAGDVTGTIGAVTVSKIQGKAVSAGTPSTGQVLKWDGSQWAPAIDIGTNGADASSLRGTSVASTSPSTGQYLKYDGTNWGPATIPAIPTALSSFTNDSLFITSAALPTKLSQLSNDPGFITAAAVPTKVSQLSNDSGFLTSATIPGVPTNLSQFVNDTNFISSVTKLQSTTVSPAAPATGQFLKFDGTSWSPATIVADPAVGGDLSGTVSSASVVKLRGRTVSAVAPVDGQMLAWNSGTSQWTAVTVKVQFPPRQITTPSYCRKVLIPWF